jgi:dTDP-4-amino-4,6-dideoxygalactose transaminase
MTCTQGLFAEVAMQPDEDLASLVCEAEEALKASLGIAHVSLNASGLTSLQAALHACGAVPGSEVICDVLFPFGILAARLVGATPVAADISLGSLTMDPESLRKAISPRTKAVIATASYGVPPAIGELRSALCDRADVLLIEDHAQAFVGLAGRLSRDVPDLMCLSFQSGKPLSIGYGGAVACTSASLDVAARRYIGLGWYPRRAPDGQMNWESSWKEREADCQSARLPPVAAGLLLARLRQMRAQAAEHSERVDELAGLLKARLPGIAVQASPGNAILWRVALIAPCEAEAREVHCALAAVGSNAYRLAHPPVPNWPCFREIGIVVQPNTADLLTRIVLLPVCGPGEVEREIEAARALAC